jgi:hypothetical protein
MNTLSCHWSGFAPGTTTFCEARLCAWIESPAIAFTGIAYVVMAILIFRDLRATDSWLTKSFAWITLSMGLSSFAFHSSHILLFQAWDLASMFALASAMLVANVQRIRGFAPAPLFTGLILGSVTLFTYVPMHPGVIPFGIILGVALVLEFPAQKKTPDFKYGSFRLAAVFFAIAFAALRIEKTSLCDPENHYFQWHAVWDTTAAVCYYLLYRHYRQCEAARLG